MTVEKETRYELFLNGEDETILRAAIAREMDFCAGSMDSESDEAFAEAADALETLDTFDKSFRLDQIMALYNCLNMYLDCPGENIKRTPRRIAREMREQFGEIIFGKTNEEIDEAV